MPNEEVIIAKEELITWLIGAAEMAKKAKTKNDLLNNLQQITNGAGALYRKASKLK